MFYTLVFDKEFVRDFRKLDNSIQQEAAKRLKRLKEDPKEIGKPLKYFANLFELHVRMYRIFYVIEESKSQSFGVGDRTQGRNRCISAQAHKRRNNEKVIY